MRDKVIVVTGGANGIGAGLARRFAEEGAAGVVVSDRDIDAATVVADGIGPQALPVHCDVTSEADIQALVAATVRRFGRLDVFISNAGVSPQPGGVGLEDLVWERMWQVHVMAHVWAARAVIPGMIERGEGYFMITSSAAGVLNLVESAPYAASKHGAVALAEWLRIAYGRLGVRVSCLCPQAVQSQMTKDGAGSAEGDVILTAAEAADRIVTDMRNEQFLILTHPETATYMRRKINDYDRWLGGMQKVYRSFWANQSGVAPSSHHLS